MIVSHRQVHYSPPSHSRVRSPMYARLCPLLALGGFAARKTTLSCFSLATTSLRPVGRAPSANRMPLTQALEEGEPTKKQVFRPVLLLAPPAGLEPPLACARCDILFVRRRAPAKWRVSLAGIRPQRASTHGKHRKS